jgi:hypothetical protein
MFIPKFVSTSQNVSELPQHDTQYEYGVINIMSDTFCNT